MITNEQAKEAIATIKAFCNERYKEDDHGNVMCVGCHFFSRRILQTHMG